MSHQRTTNGKRQRELNRKDRARAKQVRLAARRAERAMQGPSTISANEQPGGPPPVDPPPIDPPFEAAPAREKDASD